MPCKNGLDCLKLKNKVVWVTGASSGIGEALTYELNNCGALTIISSRREEALKKVKFNCLFQDNKMDESQINGLSAKECALQIIKAIAKQKEEVFIGRKEIWAVYIKIFFPSLFSGFISKQKPVNNE